MGHDVVSRIVLTLPFPVFGKLHGGAETLGDTV